MPTLTVAEQGKRLDFSFAEILKYHGPGFPGGVAHGFKAMEAGFARLNEGKPIERRELVVETAFPGPGARDAFEMVTRAVTGDRYRLDTSLGDDLVIAAAKGRYYFRFSYRGQSVELGLRPGIVVEEFIELGRIPDKSTDQAKRMTVLKQEMADRIMGLPAEDVYQATD